MAKKKPNKQQREQKKTEHANTWRNGFDFGYNMGYAQALQDKEKELMDLLRRERIKAFNFGR